MTMLRALIILWLLCLARLLSCFFWVFFPVFVVLTVCLPQILVAVVYNPFTAELYHAVRGNGAYLNGARLEVSGATTLDRAMVVGQISAEMK